MTTVTIAGFEFDKGGVKHLTRSEKDALVVILTGLKEHGSIQIDLDDSPESYALRKFFASDAARDYLLVCATDGSEDLQDAHSVVIAHAEPPYIHWYHALTL